MRLGIGIVVVAQSMIFGLALNLHDDVPEQVRWFAQSALLGATVLVLALLGGPLVRTAWRELRCGRLTIEALFLLTLSGAMAASLQAHFTGRGKIYFEVVSVLLVVYTLGKMIGARSRSAALAGANAWVGELSLCRLVEAQGSSRIVPVVEIEPGDAIEVHPGESVAVDGVIRAGSGFMSESPVSGEPFAVVRNPGDRVLAGVASFDATFRIEATAKGTERQVDRLFAEVEAAHDRPVSLQGQADRLGRAFFPLVALTALATFGYWTWLDEAGWEAGLFNAMSVLLVACPCVIGLATPIAIWTALAKLAERGLIVRSGDAVERLAEVDCVLLDKTGTLTEDRFTIVDISTTATGAEREKLLGWLSLIESHSSHPIAKPFAELLRPFAPDEEPRVAEFRVAPGRGVEAELVERNGARHFVQLFASDRKSNAHEIAVTVNGATIALATVRERLRDAVPQALAVFDQLGLPVEVLTGDSRARAAALHLPNVRAGLQSDDKRMRVEALKQVGAKPLMVGDGINDVAALASAHVGVALASGTDLAVATSDATLYHGDFRVLPWAVQLSRSALRATRRNLLRAVVYNLMGMVLAACGLLHPVAAVALMVASSLSLVFSAARFDASPIRCGNGGRAGTAANRRTVVHFASLSLQSLVLFALLAPAPALPGAAFLLCGFGIAAAVVAFIWHRWESIPHSLDMIFGMLTLGNLGMLLGWWTDNDFAPVRCAACCSCGDPLARPGMWLGMLLFSNLAMLWLGRRALRRDGHHAIAMFTGGNVGMLLGMAFGGRIATELAAPSTGGLVLAHFAGMTLGMVAGMLLGTWATERMFAMTAWLGSGSSVLPDEVERRQAEGDDDDRIADVLRR